MKDNAFFIILGASILMIGAFIAIFISMNPFPQNQILCGTVIAKSWGVSSGDTVVTVGNDLEHRSIAFPNSESICNLEIGKTYKISYHYQWNKTYLDGYEEIEESPCGEESNEQ